MKMHLGIIGRVLMNMTDNRWVIVFVLAVALVAVNHNAWTGRVEQLREWNGGADGVFRTSR